jgi:hypothetical protein
VNHYHKSKAASKFENIYLAYIRFKNIIKKIKIFSEAPIGRFRVHSGTRVVKSLLLVVPHMEVTA